MYSIIEINQSPNMASNSRRTVNNAIKKMPHLIVLFPAIFQPIFTILTDISLQSLLNNCRLQTTTFAHYQHKRLFLRFLISVLRSQTVKPLTPQIDQLLSKLHCVKFGSLLQPTIAAFFHCFPKDNICYVLRNFVTNLPPCFFCVLVTCPSNEL